MRPPYDSPAELEAFDAKPAALAVVEEYFYTDGRECADCAHCKSWIEPHGEHCNSCAVVEGSALPSACPAWESKHITLDEEAGTAPDLDELEGVETEEGVKV